MIQSLLLLNGWAIFGDIARVLLWLILISILLGILLYIIKWIFNILGFS